MKIFGLSPEIALAKVAGVPEEYEKDFGKEILKLTESTSFIIQENTPEVFSNVVEDGSKIHLEEKAAQEFSEEFKLNLKAPPAHGTLSHALEDVYSSEILDIIELTTGQRFIYDYERFKLTNFAYRGDELKFHLKSVKPLKGNKKGADLNIYCLNQDKQVVMDIMKLQLRPRYQRLGEEGINKFFEERILFDYEIRIGYDKTAKYNDYTGRPGRYKFRRSLATSCVPASLLQLCQIKTGDMKGINRQMEIFFYSQPTIGIIKTSIKNRTPPKGRDDKWVYNFEALSVQNNKAILGAKFKATSDGDLG